VLRASVPIKLCADATYIGSGGVTLQPDPLENLRCCADLTRLIVSSGLIEPQYCQERPVEHLLGMKALTDRRRQRFAHFIPKPDLSSICSCPSKRFDCGDRNGRRIRLGVRFSHRAEDQHSQIDVVVLSDANYCVEQAEIPSMAIAN
jgi:hypothetical protein